MITTNYYLNDAQNRFHKSFIEVPQWKGYIITHMGQ